MRFLYSVADAFILTFGITPPGPERKRIAALFIGSGILLTIMMVLGLFIAAVVRILMR